MNKLFLDIETTGFSHNNDRIVEIGAVLYSSGSPRDEYQQYINPRCQVHEGAFNVHQLSDEFLADKPLFANIANSFIDFISGEDIIIHNSRFDCGILNAELKRIGKPPIEDIAATTTCTLTLARRKIPDLSAHKLDTLCDHYNIDKSARAERHGALTDAHLLAQVYFAMM